MKSPVRITLIGDYDAAKPSHRATDAALRHAADALDLAVDAAWQPTPSLLTREGMAVLETADGLWASPGSPYESYAGALAGIRFARERGKPFIGT
jgi:CTP synthase (UTP-ammonia lyase)